MSFEPRDDRGKRANTLPAVRLDDEEMEEVRWLVQRLSAVQKRDLTISDVIRIALARCIAVEHSTEQTSTSRKSPQALNERPRSPKARK